MGVFWVVFWRLEFFGSSVGAQGTVLECKSDLPHMLISEMQGLSIPAPDHRKSLATKTSPSRVGLDWYCGRAPKCKVALKAKKEQGQPTI